MKRCVWVVAALSAQLLFPGCTAERPVSSNIVPGAEAAGHPIGPLNPVPAIRQRHDWNRFIIFVWQWQTDVRQDEALYRRANLHAFHVDRGSGREDLIDFSLKDGFPYYVDHAAGKGILNLAESLRAQVVGKRSLLVRPRSLADPDTINELERQLRDNVSTAARGLAYAYAFDDEISLGSFNSPAEVDVHPLSVGWYRRWLAGKYGTIGRLNEAWGATYSSFDQVQPAGFEEVRRSASAPPFSSWNLSPWMEWRHFMDYQFAQVLAQLTRFTNKLDPSVPAGFVGGQPPSAFGGYDYGLLSRAVQWMEGADELLRSFWNQLRRPHVQTYFLSGSTRKDTWTLWHRFVHGNQAAIAWPEGWFRRDPLQGSVLAEEVLDLAPVFQEVQGPVSEFIVSPDARLEPDRIGIYYSHPSIRAGWAMDSTVHGATWPKRSSGLDADNLSSGRLRASWCRLLEDLGYQYEFVSYLDVQEKRIDLGRRFKVIILPQVICLSDVEAEALQQFVESGGVLIADTLAGLLSETGRGRKAGILNDLFGVSRDESKGYLDGNGLAEIDAEYGSQPFSARLYAYQHSLRYGSMVVFERGTRAATGAAGEAAGTAQVLIRRKVGRGETLYLNLTPLAYGFSQFRSGEVGREWRVLMGRVLIELGLAPRVQVEFPGSPAPFVESVLWRNGDRYCLALISNEEMMWERQTSEIRIRLNLPAFGIRNMRTGRSFGNASSFTDVFNPCEANLYSFSGLTEQRR